MLKLSSNKMGLKPFYPIAFMWQFASEVSIQKVEQQFNWVVTKWACQIREQIFWNLTSNALKIRQLFWLQETLLYPNLILFCFAGTFTWH